MATFTSSSPNETLALGEAWGREAQRGWVFGLTGDLGAGKTQLVKGIARGLGIAERISSPTFALVNEYATGRLLFFHLDLYRLDRREQVIAAGLENYLTNPTGVTVVEWIERWLGDIPPEATGRSLGGNGDAPRLRRVWIDCLSETERRIRHEDTRP